ncbi:MAG: YncE family protein, partial [Alphaproteobacteria bacterium]
GERGVRHLAVALLLLSPVIAMAQTAAVPLELEAKVPLGRVSGRIDHLAIDLKRQWLSVAELGNDSVGVIDVANRRLISTVSGFNEPQGIAYEPSTDTLYVANAKDGSVRLMRGGDFTPLGRIDLGGDADNVRIDSRRGQLLVGYGGGALAVIDPKARAKLADIPLKGHPEGFQIEPGGARAFVNVPDARLIQIVDLSKREAVGALPTEGHRANFPMALDEATHRILIGFRSPARLLVLSTTDGSVVADLNTCGDADDLFIDAMRHRVYVICGAGVVDVFEDNADAYQHIGRVGTASGARTGLFVPELDRLFVAVRPAGSEPAAIWVLRPSP